MFCPLAVEWGNAADWAAAIAIAGAVTATAFATAIEDPGNFRKSRSVGAWLGLTTRRYQSGEVDYDGHISRRGDSYVRAGCSMRRQP